MTAITENCSQLKPFVTLLTKINRIFIILITYKITSYQVMAILSFNQSYFCASTEDIYDSRA